MNFSPLPLYLTWKTQSKTKEILIYFRRGVTLRDSKKIGHNVEIMDLYVKVRQRTSKQRKNFHVWYFTRERNLCFQMWNYNVLRSHNMEETK